MLKTRAIAITAVSLGMVAVTGVAGFAVVSSTNASVPTDTITLLADENPVSSGPNFVPGDLPPIPIPDSGAVSATAPDPAAATNTSPQTSTSDSALITVLPKSTAVTTPLTTPEITSLQARTAVLNEVKGSVTSITEVVHNGFEAFAVKVALADGGTATGYVHKTSGVVFDWNVVGAPAAPTSGGSAKAPAAQTNTSREDDDDHEENEHKSPEQKRPSSSHDEDDD